MRKGNESRGMRAIAFGVLLIGFGLQGCGGETKSLTACEPADGVDPVCGFTNPEDLALLPGGSWLAVSQMPKGLDASAATGSVIAWRPSDDRRAMLFPPPAGTAASVGTGPSWGDPACAGPPAPEDFGAHGIDVIRLDSGETALAVVAHGTRETIQFFEFDWTADGPRASWKGCVETPEGVWPNDVALRPNGEIVVSKMMSAGSSATGVLEAVRMIFGMDTGYVLSWAPGAGWNEIEGTRGAAPNGVAITPDGGEVFFAEWRGQRLVRVRRGEGGQVEVDAVSLSSYPDNLSWTPDGRLLVAGQVGDWSELIGCAQIEEGNCAAGFEVVRVDPSTLRTEVILDHPGTATGGVSSALVMGDELYVGTFSGDRVARVPYAP